MALLKIPSRVLKRAMRIANAVHGEIGDLPGAARREKFVEELGAASDIADDMAEMASEAGKTIQAATADLAEQLDEIVSEAKGTGEDSATDKPADSETKADPA